MKESEILKQGKILIYPSDTIWGIGCNALDINAIEKVKQIKGRDNSKSLIVLVKDIEMLSKYVEQIPKCALDLINSTNKPITIIYDKAKNLPINNLSSNKKIGIRIARSEFLDKLFKEFEYPIVSTSANYSGKASPMNFNDIDKELLQQVDYVSLYGRKNKENKVPSSIYIIENNNTLKQIR